jgi:hypothetical protein
MQDPASGVFRAMIGRVIQAAYSRLATNLQVINYRNSCLFSEG